MYYLVDVATGRDVQARLYIMHHVIMFLITSNFAVG